VKRRVVVAGIVLFALWPLVHRGLVAAFDVNPWKLAGWAMYVRPHFPSQIRLLRLPGEVELAIEELQPYEQALAGDFVERRFSVGRLASAESLARELLRRDAGAEAIVVEIRQPYFETSTARIEERTERRVFPR